MTRILVAASPIYGHFTPLRAVAEFLADRGHDVSVLGQESFRGSVDTNRVHFVPFTGRAAVDPMIAVQSDERMAIPAGPERFAWDMRNSFVEPMAAQHRDVQEFIAQSGDEPVLLAYETGFLGATPSLLGAPGPRPAAALGLGPVSFTLASEDTAPFGMGLPPDNSEAGRARNREANALVQGQLLGAAQELFERTLAELGVTEQPVPFFLDSTVLTADRFLQLSIEELSYHRGDTPDHVRFVGALPAKRAVGVLPEWWPEVLKADQVVVVTQGTVANHDFAELIEPTLLALADFPGLVVAATGRPGEVSHVPANARVTEFVPFDDLLPEASVLVTNGGFGAVQQALRSGTPLVTAGLSEEKLENNVRLAATGAAVDLATERPTPAEVLAGVGEVLGNDSFRANAQRLAAEYAKLDAYAEIEKTIAELGF